MFSVALVRSVSIFIVAVTAFPVLAISASGGTADVLGDGWGNENIAHNNYEDNMLHDSLSRLQINLENDGTFFDSLLEVMDNFIDDASVDELDGYSDAAVGEKMPVYPVGMPIELDDLPTPIAQLILDLSEYDIRRDVADILCTNRFNSRATLQKYLKDNLDVYEAYIVQHWKLKKKYPGSKFDAHIWFDRFRDTLYLEDYADPPKYTDIIKNALLGESSDNVLERIVKVLSTAPVQERLKLLDGLGNNANFRDWAENYSKLNLRTRLDM